MTIITVRMTITIIRLKQKHNNKTLSNGDSYL